MSIADRTGNSHNPYFDLVRQFPLRPLRSDEDLNHAVAMVDALLDRASLLPEEQDYVDVLSNLVHDYESEEHPMPPLPDHEMLRHLIEAKGVSQVEVARATGIVESTISAALKGARPLNRRHIGKLARYFNVAPGVFAF